MATCMGRAAGTKSRAPIDSMSASTAGGDGLDLGDDDVGLLEIDDRAKGDRVEHVDDVCSMGEMHGMSIGVAIDATASSPSRQW